MNKRIAMALLGLLASLALLGLGGWLWRQRLWGGAPGLVLIGGLLGLLFSVVLLRRIAHAGRRLPMN